MAAGDGLAAWRPRPRANAGEGDRDSTCGRAKSRHAAHRATVSNGGRSIAMLSDEAKEEAPATEEVPAAEETPVNENKNNSDSNDSVEKDKKEE